MRGERSGARPAYAYSQAAKLPVSQMLSNRADPVMALETTADLSRDDAKRKLRFVVGNHHRFPRQRIEIAGCPGATPRLVHECLRPEEKNTGSVDRRFCHPALELAPPGDAKTDGEVVTEEPSGVVACPVVLLSWITEKDQESLHTGPKGAAFRSHVKNFRDMMPP